jgi:hypothetical protein
LADFVSSFFEALNNTMQALVVYDQEIDETAEVNALWMSTVPKIKEAFRPLLNEMIKILYNASLEKEPTLLHEILKWLHDMYIIFTCAIPLESDIKDCLSEQQLDQLLQEVIHFQSSDAFLKNKTVSQESGLIAMYKLLTTKLYA